MAKVDIKTRLEELYKSHKTVGVALIVLRPKDWQEYFNQLTPRLQDMYNKMGFYKVNIHDKYITACKGDDPTYNTVNGVKATTFKGIAVITTTDYIKLKEQVPNHKKYKIAIL